MANQTAAVISTSSGAVDAYRLRGGMIPLNATRFANEEQLNKKAKEFESMFIGQMLHHMFDGIETNELFGGGEGEDVYKSFLLDKYADIITQSGGIGIASQVKAEMIRMQDIQMAAQGRMPQAAVAAAYAR